MSTQVPKTMRAIQISENGGLDVIKMNENAPVPEPAENEILVKVEWAGVNYIDTYHRAGVYPTPFPFTLGQEAVGTIVKLPISSSILNSDDFKLRDFNIGDRVVAYTPRSFAQYTTSEWASVFKIPANVDGKVACAAALQGLTALTAIREAYAVQKGDWILVHAAAGGLGLHLCQLGFRIGAHVIGTTSTPEKAALAKENGAEHVVLYTKENIVDKVLELTGGEGVHGIFDGVGKDTWEDNFKVIRRKGTLVSIGNASGVVPPFPPLKLTPKNVRLLRPTLKNYIYTPAESFAYYTELFNIISEPGYKVYIHEEYEFSENGIRKAQGDITGRGTIGKLLVRVV